MRIEEKGFSFSGAEVSPLASRHCISPISSSVRRCTAPRLITDAMERRGWGRNPFRDAPFAIVVDCGVSLELEQRDEDR